MRRRLCLWVAALTWLGSGCSLAKDATSLAVYKVRESTDDFCEGIRDRKWADHAWEKARRASPGAYSEDYARGFKDGFAHYLFRGGKGEPPPLPPPHYRKLSYQTPQGYRAIEDWYAGFRHGTDAARQSGYRQFITGPSALRVSGPVPPPPEPGTDQAAPLPPPPVWAPVPPAPVAPPNPSQGPQVDKQVPAPETAPLAPATAWTIAPPAPVTPANYVQGPPVEKQLPATGSDPLAPLPPPTAWTSVSPAAVSPAPVAPANRPQKPPVEKPLPAPGSDPLAPLPPPAAWTIAPPAPVTPSNSPGLNKQ